MVSDPSQTPPAGPAPGPSPEVSVVVPVFNESGAAPDLAREIAAAFAGWPVEILFVDDCSRDDTRERLAALKTEIPALRLLAHSVNSGQSRAVRTGVLAARGEIIVTLDGDGQNDPADIPALFETRGLAELVMGNRVRRRDTWLRHLQSRVANGVRGRLLGDGTPDTGCGIKVMRRDVFMELPRFDHMHRFLPALFLRAGARVVSVPVAHRPRERGTSKYGLFDRLWVGIVDIFGVMWLRRRAKPGLRVTED